MAFGERNTFINPSDLQGVPSVQRIGLIDLEFDCSTFCPTLPWLVGIWQKWLGTWAKLCNPQFKVNQIQVYYQMGHPVNLVRIEIHYGPLNLVKLNIFLLEGDEGGGGGCGERQRAGEHQGDPEAGARFNSILKILTKILTNFR